jgi:hypothetical protein
MSAQLPGSTSGPAPGRRPRPPSPSYSLRPGHLSLGCRRLLPLRRWRALRVARCSFCGTAAPPCLSLRCSRCHSPPDRAHQPFRGRRRQCGGAGGDGDVGGAADSRCVRVLYPVHSIVSPPTSILTPLPYISRLSPTFFNFPPSYFILNFSILARSIWFISCFLCLKIYLIFPIKIFFQILVIL